jgi:GNAT superfamily N-acetyltransferase
MTELAQTNASTTAGSGASLKIVELPRNGKNVSRFLQVPYPIYGDDPYWVAPLLDDLKKVFTDRNPLFEHAEMILWVAVRDGKDVGRIAGILDRNHNAFHKESTAFFGYFESINDQTVADALFDAAAQWARGKGMNRVLGPMNPTTNDECGLLIEGFDSRPVIMMTYNPRYYIDLLAGSGLIKAKDLLAYSFNVSAEANKRLHKIASGVQRREKEIVVRPIRKKTLAQDLVKVKDVYNGAWEENWGFVPMTDAELDFMGERLKPLLHEEIALLAEIGGEAVGFMMSLPDFNEPIQPMKGKLITPKIFNFLRYLLGWKRPEWARVVTLGIKKKYRQRGIDALMLSASLEAGLKAGYRKCEASWMLEDNFMILRPMEVFGGKKYKTYRIYERAV